MSTEVTALERQAQTFTTEVTALAVVDNPSFERAGEMAKAIAGYIKRVGEVMNPIVTAAHNAHKVAVQQRDALLKPAEGAKRILGERMAAYEREQARLRREAEEAARREQERLEREAQAAAAAEQKRLQAEAETRRLEEAAALEARGDGAAAERLLAEPVAVPVVTAAPVFVPTPRPFAPAPRVDGVGFRQAWSAEVTDLLALVRAVAAGQQPITLLQPNMPVLNQMARALKGALNVPGVKPVPTDVAAVRA